MNKVNGWIKLYRSLQDNWIWKKKPFSRGQAWVDLLLNANYQDKKFPLGADIVEVERGEIITSELKLMEQWGWSKSKVRKFLETLEKDSMIVKKTDRKKTTIKLVQFSDYQDIETTKRPKKDHEETTERPQKDTNKKDKKEKKDKNNIYTSCAREIIDYLNLKTGKKFKYGESHLNAIIPRLKDGFTVEDCQKVIDVKASQWLNTENDKYLRPETLFRASKFDGYLNEREFQQKKSVNSKTVSDDFSFEEKIEEMQRRELKRSQNG